jgi:hypothetical protein
MRAGRRFAPRFTREGRRLEPPTIGVTERPTTGSRVEVGDSSRVDTPDIHYARSGDVAIAYQVIGVRLHAVVSV